MHNIEYRCFLNGSILLRYTEKEIQVHMEFIRKNVKLKNEDRGGEGSFELPALYLQFSHLLIIKQQFISFKSSELQSVSRTDFHTKLFFGLA